MKPRCLLFLACVAPAACIYEPSGTPGNPTLSDGDEIVTVEGAVGRVSVRTPTGTRTLTYVVRGGHAIHDLDIDLGPVEKLRLRGAANMGERWPDGQVTYAFADDFAGQVCASGMTSCQDVRTRVRETLAAMERKLPMRFTEVPFEIFKPMITYQWGDSDQSVPGQSSHTGRDAGGQTIKFRRGHETDPNPAPFPALYNLQPQAGTVRHETLHGLGLWHEQSRTDRDSFVDVQYECIERGEDNGNFDIHDDATDVGPYDFASIMHYGPNTQCVKELDLVTCKCTPMIPIPSNAVIDPVTFAGFSIEDTNSLYRMYARAPGDNEAGDRFGAVLAAGDFDGDGYDDLAVGAPSESVNTGVFPNIVTRQGAGAVDLWKGTPGGLVAWRRLTLANFTGQTVTAFASFGTALVAYDANGDGIKDLAVGAPNLQAGAVFVWKGTRETGLEEHRWFTQVVAGGTSVAGDGFGAGLAAGRITGHIVNAKQCADGMADPGGSLDTLVIGAPGDGPAIGGVRAGAVYLFQELRSACQSDTTLARATVINHLSHAGANIGDGFGTALAVGSIDGDGLADLVIGAPMFSNATGRAYLYQGRRPTEQPLLWSSMVTERTSIAGTAASRFGTSIAIGQLFLDVLAEGLVTIGAPGTSSGSGAVKVYRGAFTPTVAATITNTSGNASLGTRLVIGDVDRGDGLTRPDLVIGAPGSGSQGGAVLVVRGGSPSSCVTGNTCFPIRTVLQQPSSPVGDRDPNDQFGSALAIGSFDGASERLSTADTGTVRQDLAVGAPGEAVDSLLGSEGPTAGAVDVFLGVHNQLVIWSAARHQAHDGHSLH
jgi:Astacin (Peptidase family M12A)/FG-GAP repeat